jgi:REP element-mobilizing transposase RayT
MARQLRLAFEDACYHITSRGSRKEKIFYSDQDKSVFLEKLNETLNRYSVVCYAYCLMDNHYHLFIRTPKANISQSMHFLNTSYTNWFKAEHKIIGPVLQGRYKSIIVDEDSYGIVLSAYIHLNPLRAKMVDELKEYQWSSYSDYITSKKGAVDRLDTEFILGQISEDIKDARRFYRRYVRENQEMRDPAKDSYRGIVLGGKDYIGEILRRIDNFGRKREIRATRIINTKTAEEIIDIIKEVHRIPREEIIEKGRGNLYRKISMYLVKKHTDLKLEEIGRIYGMDYSAVSQSCKRFESEIDNNKKLHRMVKEIESAIN